MTRSNDSTETSSRCYGCGDISPGQVVESDEGGNEYGYCPGCSDRLIVTGIEPGDHSKHELRAEVSKID